MNEIKIAFDRIQAYVNKTPVLTLRTLDVLTNAEVFLKCENFQRVGAFKARGAFNTLLQMSDKEKEKGVIAHSSGNHAQAVPLAASILKIKATIVMPQNAPAIKRETTLGYGAQLVDCGNNPPDRKMKTDELIKEHGYTLIHPYDDLRIVHGAGTTAYELINEIKDLDIILTPVGGGGLLSGTCLAVKENFPGTQIYGVK